MHPKARAHPMHLLNCVLLWRAKPRRHTFTPGPIWETAGCQQKVVADLNPVWANTVISHEMYMTVQSGFVQMLFAICQWRQMKTRP